MPDPRLFLDADGVLADFDEGARRLLGMSVRDYERRHGRGGFWKKLAQAKDFPDDPSPQDPTGSHVLAQVLAAAQEAVAELRAGRLEPRPDTCAWDGGCAHPTICRCDGA